MVIKLEDDDYIRFLNDRHVHEDEIIDPVYKVFLEHLREDGKSYVFEMVNADNGLPLTIKYEGEHGVSEKNKADIRTSSRDTSFEGRDRSAAKREQSRNFRSDISEDVRLSSGSNKQSESPLVDESYWTFLSYLKFKGRSMILQLDSVSVTYEQETETSMSSETLASENNVNSDEQGLVPYETAEPSEIIVYEDGNSPRVSSDCDCYELTDFKTKLATVLSRPYDQAEYEKLLKAATERKPLTKQKHLRSSSISYATKQVGQSYLDHFPDLAEQIWSVDCNKRLNLLRGFFFWLKNLCHEGAYMPWASSDYEVIAPDDCEVVLPLDIAID